MKFIYPERLWCKLVSISRWCFRETTGFQQMRRILLGQNNIFIHNTASAPIIGKKGDYLFVRGPDLRFDYLTSRTCLHSEIRQIRE